MSEYERLMLAAMRSAALACLTRNQPTVRRPVTHANYQALPEDGKYRQLEAWR